MIFVSTIGFSGMADLVVWSEITIHIALWVKSKMAAFCTRSKNKLISFSTQTLFKNKYYLTLKFALCPWILAFFSKR